MAGAHPGYVIRLATAADIPAITAMYRHDGLLHAQGDPERAEYSYASVRAAGGNVLVALEGAAVIGHLELLLCQEVLPLGRYGYLEALEVRVDRRRCGVGRALVEAAKALTRAAGGERHRVPRRGRGGGTGPARDPGAAGANAPLLSRCAA